MEWNVLKNHYEFWEALSSLLDDVLILSVELEWSTQWRESKEYVASKYKELENIDYDLPRVEKYFTLDEQQKYNDQLFLILEDVIKQLEHLAKEIESMTYEQKQELVTRIKARLKAKEDFWWVVVAKRYRKMIFAELGLDFVDESGKARDITISLMERLMVK